MLQGLKTSGNLFCKEQTEKMQSFKINIDKHSCKFKDALMLMRRKRCIINNTYKELLASNATLTTT